MLPFPSLVPSSPEREPEELPRGGSPYVGQLHQVMVAISRVQRDRAVELATRWQLEHPGDVAAIIALGEAAEARGATAIAARAYGSLADLYPNRAELLRVAGQRLDRVGARSLAVAAYSRAVRERPDQVTGHRLLAYALFRAGEPDVALTTLLEAIPRAAEPIAAVLRQDARVIAAHLAARSPARRDELRKRAGELPAKPSLQIVLSWETDANDVDLHVWDRRNRHASFREPELKSGGVLLHDLTDGFGPEMFVVENPAAFPYTIAAHYYSRGPMGLGLGTVQVIHHDGNGNIKIDDRPFVIQKDGATVELGTIR
jgi:tetratricopeptide (TPR) repeat protein